ncbi:MAG: LapA family protein, partial [Desulfobulbales bacterium]|nr:LapA family protein [Desulfobulbales bacterium]
MKNPKLLAALALAGLVIIFLYQNAATVEIRFLFWEAAMSLSLLIFLVLAIGILTGWLLHS